jgi:lipopolysaccharide biosynthesis protein
MKSICLFASYFRSVDIPYAIEVYLLELKKQFDELVFITSQEPLSEASQHFLNVNNISFFIEKNEGYDFGQWYKAFQKLEIKKYDQVALVNDSCILFKSLDAFMNWTRINKADLQGMTYSDAIAPHIQSYFLIVNRPILASVKDYFDSHKIVQTLDQVIKTYEVGLSTFIISKGFKIAAYMDEIGSDGEFSPYYSHVKEHLERGIPLIKKKILLASYRSDELFTLARMNFDVDQNHYRHLIEKQNSDLLLSFDKLYSLEKPVMSNFTRVKYKALRLLIKIYRKIKYGR